MTRILTRRGQIVHPEDPGLEVGFLAPIAAALALIPSGHKLRRKKPTPTPTTPKVPVAPPVVPVPRPSNEAALRAELERVKRAQAAAAATVAAERAAAEKAAREVEAQLAAERARAAKAEAELAKATAQAGGSRKAYDDAIGKLQQQLAEAERARDLALQAGDKAADAEIKAARAQAAKAGERAAAELKARKRAEAELAKQEAAQRAREAALKKSQAAALQARASEIEALREELKASGDSASALKAEQARTRAAAKALEAEQQARAAAEAELAATKAALEAAKENRQTPPAPQTEMEPLQAAKALRAYLRANPTRAAFGYPQSPSEQVMVYQRYLPGVQADGIVGRGTRNAASALGVTLPPRPGATPSEPLPEEPPLQSSTDPSLMAQQLRAYLLANPTQRAFGTRGNPSAPVLQFQRAAGFTGRALDGIVGKGVRGAAAKYGVSLPARPKK